MVVNALKPLNQIATFLKVQPGKITLDDDSMPVRVVNKNTSSGYINIILELVKEGKASLEGCSDLEKALIRQWIEYGFVYVAKADNPQQILKELNAVLATRTYLVAHKLTIADVFLYYFLQDIMGKLSILEKEKYSHVSRWFDNLQQNSSIRQSNKLVNFDTLYLASVAPARR
ncbi:eukaryotic translation elongation factor 1 epsilon-1 [Tribolium castaneum]|uniref:Eukaryotic translation elongation factor 1 epsilon-1-like Protein n=1 Tax=Tribolium castaneum TaxID=7070 RepID=A0A139WEF6_TRICA|nr:PREDICTED: eukaryotic translation elongation factor 1 epsilon-1 [Tribolium castaneum]KYB26302.1 Eukaryotic translation elongation factor 1 epsilon-1-like Protein [Tribolium castaneum]|eukprot:XP_008195648.1 PREDICTED: eukaryotic translation elongation factor 1 epsilon-1 [Tribolium castaneum]